MRGLSKSYQVKYKIFFVNRSGFRTSKDFINFIFQQKHVSNREQLRNKTTLSNKWMRNTVKHFQNHLQPKAKYPTVSD